MKDMKEKPLTEGSIKRLNKDIKNFDTKPIKPPPSPNPEKMEAIDCNCRRCMYCGL